MEVNKIKNILEQVLDCDLFSPPTKLRSQEVQLLKNLALRIPMKSRKNFTINLDWWSDRDKENGVDGEVPLILVCGQLSQRLGRCLMLNGFTYKTKEDWPSDLIENIGNPELCLAEEGILPLI